MMKSSGTRAARRLEIRPKSLSLFDSLSPALLQSYDLGTGRFSLGHFNTGNIRLFILFAVCSILREAEIFLLRGVLPKP